MSVPSHWIFSVLCLADTWRARFLYYWKYWITTTFKPSLSFSSPLPKRHRKLEMDICNIPPLTLLVLRLLLIKGTRMQKIVKVFSTLSYWYSSESSCWILSDEYPCARVSDSFRLFSHYFVRTKLATSSIRANWLISVLYWSKDWSCIGAPRPEFCLLIV